MDTLPDPATMTDQALVAEYNCIDCKSIEDDARSEALVAEMAKREIDF